MGYVLNSHLVSVTHTWGKACLMSQPSKVEQHSPQPRRPKEEIIISAGSNKCPITQSTGFQLHTERIWPPHTHTLPLAYGFKAKNIYWACEAPGHLGIKPGKRIQKRARSCVAGVERWDQIWPGDREEGPGHPSSVFTLYLSLRTRAQRICRDSMQYGQLALEWGAGSTAGLEKGCGTQQVTGRGLEPRPPLAAWAPTRPTLALKRKPAV